VYRDERLAQGQHLGDDRRREDTHGMAGDESRCHTGIVDQWPPARHAGDYQTELSGDGVVQPFRVVEFAGDPQFRTCHAGFGDHGSGCPRGDFGERNRASRGFDLAINPCRCPVEGRVQAIQHPQHCGARIVDAHHEIEIACRMHSGNA